MRPLYADAVQHQQHGPWSPRRKIKGDLGAEDLLLFEDGSSRRGNQSGPTEWGDRDWGVGGWGCGNLEDIDQEDEATQRRAGQTCLRVPARADRYWTMHVLGRTRKAFKAQPFPKWEDFQVPTARVNDFAENLYLIWKMYHMCVLCICIYMYLIYMINSFSDI